MPVMRVINNGMPVKVWTDDIDSNALLQLENMSRMPFIYKHIAVMPDVHWGNGATIGSVTPSKGAIIPAAYKSIEKVMENQSDLVEIVHTLHQVVNVKG